MTEQSDERRDTAEVWENLVSLMVPDVDPELVRLILSHTTYSMAGGRVDHEGQEGRAGEGQIGLLGELVELLALIRDADLDRAQLRAILGLSPNTPPVVDDNPHTSSP